MRARDDLIEELVAHMGVAVTLRNEIEIIEALHIFHDLHTPGDESYEEKNISLENLVDKTLSWEEAWPDSDGEHDLMDLSAAGIELTKWRVFLRVKHSDDVTEALVELADIIWEREGGDDRAT